MTVHRFPDKKRPPKPKVQGNDIEYATDELETARGGTQWLEHDLERAQHILQTVGPRLTPAARDALTERVHWLGEHVTEARAERDAWSEILAVLIREDAGDDSPRGA